MLGELSTACKWLRHKNNVCGRVTNRTRDATGAQACFVVYKRHFFLGHASISWGFYALKTRFHSFANIVNRLHFLNAFCVLTNFQRNDDQIYCLNIHFHNACLSFIVYEDTTINICFTVTGGRLVIWLEADVEDLRQQTQLAGAFMKGIWGQTCTFFKWLC